MCYSWIYPTNKTQLYNEVESVEEFDFGRRLQEVRESCCMTQAQAARKLGISRSCISSYECNREYPSIPKLKEIARLYRVSTDYLLGLQEPDFISLEDVPLERRPCVREVVTILKRGL